MISSNKKKFSVVSLFLGIILITVSAYSPVPETKADFKNLQILPKDISEHDLDSIMHGFNDALGVRCMFCHVHTGDDFRKGWDFASDDKDEKQVARHMLKMTYDINDKYFNFNNSTRPDTISAVTCVTCHRGSEHPDAETIAEQMHKGGDSMYHRPPPPPPGQAPSQK